MAEYVEAIRHAPDPSAAVAAYAAAIAADHSSLAPAEAYVHRMIELGTPGMAYTQAHELLQREPGNGLAWGVMADVDARRGQFVTALDDIVKAVRNAPNDPFVHRTAAGLVAWYDIMADQSQVSADLKHSLGQMRKQLDKEKTFTEAYAEAKAFYERMKTEQAQAGATAPAAPESTDSSTPAGYSESGPEVYVTPADTTYIYDTYPYYAYDYGFYPTFPIYGGYCYGGWPYCYGGSCWWPVEPFCFGGVGPFFGHNRFGFDGFGFHGRHGFRGFEGHGEFGHGSFGAFNHSGFGRGFGRVGGVAGSRAGVGTLGGGHFHSSLPIYGGRGSTFSGGGSHGFRSASVSSFGGRSGSAHFAPRGSSVGVGSFGGGRSFGGGGFHSFGGGRSFGGGGFHSFGGGRSFGGGGHFGGGGMGHGGGGHGR